MHCYSHSIPVLDQCPGAYINADLLELGVIAYRQILITTALHRIQTSLIASHYNIYSQG